MYLLNKSCKFQKYGGHSLYFYCFLIGERRYVGAQVAAGSSGIRSEYTRELRIASVWFCQRKAMRSGRQASSGDCSTRESPRDHIYESQSTSATGNSFNIMFSVLLCLMSHTSVISYFLWSTVKFCVFPVCLYNPFSWCTNSQLFLSLILVFCCIIHWVTLCPYLKQVAIMFSQPENAIKLSLSASCDSGKICCG